MSDDQPIFSITSGDIELMILEYISEHHPQSKGDVAEDNLIINTDLVEGLSGFLHQRMEQSLNLPFNQLNPSEVERLALLVEEMGEAQQAIGKIFRHGYESKHPDGGPTNRKALEQELGDVEYIGGMLKSYGDLNADSVSKFKSYKSYRVYHYLHHHEQFVEII